MSERRRLIMPLAAAVIAVVGVGISLAGGAGVAPPVAGFDAVVAHGVDGNPFPSGKAMSLSQAQSRSPFPLSRPREDAMASDGRIAHVWFEGPPAGPRVAIAYDTGVLVTIFQFHPGGHQPGIYNSESEVAALDTIDTIDEAMLAFAEFHAEARGGSPADYLVEINGRTAVFAPTQPDAPEGMRAGSIRLAVSDSVFVQVIGEFDEQTLYRIASHVGSV